MELPESFNLTTKKRTDGRVDIIGKDDAGFDYRVRTTDGPEVTAHDIAELRDADRNAYAGMSQTQAAKLAVDKIVDHGRAQRIARETSFGEDLQEAAGQVTFGLLDRKGHSSPFTGSTRAYRKGWELAFGERNINGVLDILD